MVSKQQAKFVKSLNLKKYRNKASLFLVEGAKNVIELINSDYEIEELFITEKFMSDYPNAILDQITYSVCYEKDLVSMGTFQSNEYALAIAKMRKVDFNLSKVSFALVLDEISDPGNMGTLIRIADWYGINKIIAGSGTADFYNPKVINASMGSFCRVDVSYLDLNSFFHKNHTHHVYGAALKGDNLHHTKFQKPSLLLLGNESRGISPQLKRYVDLPITIPRIGHAESLNVAVSAAVICDNFFRT